ncbi:PilZ domain-containing protein [Gottfriedia sp. OAE603]|uniref:flagellar brake protein n=1 Tax=Gottfriedia sp. OAE603 TaxID=2663872 RepID=UPI00178AACB6
MLSIGDTVFIEEKIDDQIIYYKSRLVDILDQQLHLDIPINEMTGRNAIFTRNSKFKILFLTKRLELYTCNLTYIQSLHETVPVMVFNKPNENELVKEQRRRFFRIPSTTEITVLPIEEEFTPIKSLSQDISAGGVAIHIPKSIPLKVNQNVVLLMNLQFENSLNEEVKVESTIVRIHEAESNEMQLISLMYGKLTSQDRQKIVKYTMEQQRLQIQSLKYD